jgi:hypothetical protein
MTFNLSYIEKILKRWGMETSVKTSVGALLPLSDSGMCLVEEGYVVHQLFD